MDKTRKINWEDYNVKIAIAYLLVLAVGLLIFIAFKK